MSQKSLLTQYQLVCTNALKSMAKIGKAFQKVFIDTMILFIAIPSKINFLQLGRYGKFSEQTYRNNFEKSEFDWAAFNSSIAQEHLQGKRKVVAVDPSYIKKSGKKTPWIGTFWSGCDADYKRGMEILGIGVVDVDSKECIAINAMQTPNKKTLEGVNRTSVDWYVFCITENKEHLMKHSKILVADAFFSKITFVSPLCEEGFTVITRFRSDAVMFYPTKEKASKKRGHPKWYDGRIDFKNPDLSRFKDHKVSEGRLLSTITYSKSLKRYVKLVVWYPTDEFTKWKLYFSTDTTMDAKDIYDCYKSRFQIEFVFREAKGFAGLTNCQSVSQNKLDFHFNASLACINMLKHTCKQLDIPYSITTCKSVIHNIYMLERFICVFDESGFKPNQQVIDRLFKELVLFSARAA